MSASLVGSEMCIRDSGPSGGGGRRRGRGRPAVAGATECPRAAACRRPCCCLLYTSDAADDM
eukprot:9567939-Alexandrium_andersonii.AAC.1